MVIRLPVDKIQKINHKLLAIKQCRKVTLKELQSLIGLLNFACGCVVPGRAFLRRLYDLTCGINHPHHFIRLNKEARADLSMWSTFMQSFNGRCMFLNDDWIEADQLHLYTDAASTIGCAAVFAQNGWLRNGMINLRTII